MLTNRSRGRRGSAEAPKRHISLLPVFMVAVAVCWFLLPYSQLKAQSQREYIYLNGRLIAMENTAVPCTYALVPTTASIGPTGGGQSIGVIAPSGCAWTAVSNNQPWIEITGGSSGTGNGTVNYTVAANTGADRFGTITVAGQTFTISQSSYPQPTCLTFQPTNGFAGIDTHRVTVCNGANMTVKARYRFAAWDAQNPGAPPNESSPVQEDIVGTMNASGYLDRILPQNTTPGVSDVIAIKNNLRDDWYTLSAPYSAFMVRPPKPTNPPNFTVNGSTNYELILPENTNHAVGNSQNQTVYSEFHMTEPTLGSNLYWPFTMGSNSETENIWHSCEAGNARYLFTKIRNQLDTLDSAAWMNVNTYLRYTRGSSCPDFTLSFSDYTTVTLSSPGQSAYFYVRVNPQLGFSVPVTLSVTGLPSGSTGWFSPNPVNPSQTSVLTITTPSNLAPGNYGFTIQGSITNPENGYLTRSLSGGSFFLPGQPTCLQFYPTVGFAGIDPSHIYLCNAPNMTIEVITDFVPWTGGYYPFQGIAGTTDSNGWIYRWLPQDTAPGTSYITYVRNTARSDWVPLYGIPQMTVRPPMPTSFSMVPSTLQMPGSRTMSVGNGQNQTIVESINYPNPPGGSDQYSVPMDMSGNNYSYVPCGVLPGTYVFNAVRNQLDDAPDAWLGLFNTTQTLVACGP